MNTKHNNILEQFHVIISWHQIYTSKERLLSQEHVMTLSVHF